MPLLESALVESSKAVIIAATSSWLIDRWVKPILAVVQLPPESIDFNTNWYVGLKFDFNVGEKHSSHNPVTQVEQKYNVTEFVNKNNPNIQEFILSENDPKNLIYESKRKGDILLTELEKIKIKFPKIIKYIFGKGLISEILFKSGLFSFSVDFWLFSVYSLLELTQLYT